MTEPVVAVGDGKLVWYQSNESHSGTQVAVQVTEQLFQRIRRQGTASVHVSDWELPIVNRLGNATVIYRYPVTLQQEDGVFYVDGVYAILVGAKGQDFAGNRADYRDLINTAKAEKKFVYVLPVTSVNPSETWLGYLRVGRRRWIALPCPRPAAVYNRITLRNLERAQDAVEARARIRALRIPMFNPEYFDKTKVRKWVKTRHST